MELLSLMDAFNARVVLQRVLRTEPVTAEEEADMAANAAFALYPPRRPPGPPAASPTSCAWMNGH